MKNTLPLCIALAILPLVAFDKHAVNNDEEALKKVLFQYFDGIRHVDTVQMSKVTTADIVIYEEGENRAL
jgi:hypothetical protein